MDPVQAQLDAYNARDIDAFAACFAEDVVWTSADGEVLGRGVVQLRTDYGHMFAACPALHCRLLSRVRVGQFVLDEEWVTGKGPAPIHVVAIYRLRGDRIAAVQFLK